VVKDPDQRVRRAIELVFERFASLGTISKVLKSLLEDGASLPRFRYGGPHHGELLWCRPTTTSIHGFLSNPAYAGAFVYGRRQSVRDGGTKGRVTKPMEEWSAIHHDVYPAYYISWEEFLAKTKSASGRTATASPRTRAALQGAGRRFCPGLRSAGTAAAG
jgi:hypothetical protein